MRYNIRYKTKCGLVCEKYLCPIDGLLPRSIIRNGRVYIHSKVTQFGRHLTYVFEEQD